METIFGCFIFMQYEFQGMIGYLDFSQPGWLWREQTVTSLVFFCGNKHLLEMTSIWLVGTALWMRFGEIEQSPAVRNVRNSLEAHKKGKQESDWICFMVPHKLPMKYKAAALSCEQREKSCCKACSQQCSWMRICTNFLTDLSLAL